MSNPCDDDQNPCGAQDPCNAGPPASLCDGDKENNVWMDGQVCLLDTLNEWQVCEILSRDEVARNDLKRVTTDARLLELAHNVPRLPTGNASDEMQHKANTDPGSIPFYTVFKGRPPFAQ